MRLGGPRERRAANLSPRWLLRLNSGPQWCFIRVRTRRGIEWKFALVWFCIRRLDRWAQRGKNSCSCFVQLNFPAAVGIVKCLPYVAEMAWRTVAWSNVWQKVGWLIQLWHSTGMVAWKMFRLSAMASIFEDCLYIYLYEPRMRFISAMPSAFLLIIEACLILFPLFQELDYALFLEP